MVKTHELEWTAIKDNVEQFVEGFQKDAIRSDVQYLPF